MINHDRFDELIPIYALGALDGEEQKEIEEHLRTDCPICKEKLKEMEDVQNLIPYSIPPSSPSPDVKKRLFERIIATKTVHPESHDREIKEKPYATPFWQRLGPIWPGLGGAVALGLLIFLFVSNLGLRDELREQQLEISSLEKQINRQSEVIEYLQDPNVMVISLIGLEPGPEARGRILWDTKNNKAFFYGLNLPQAPSGKTYQLWVIADNTPRSAGTFNVNEKGNNVMKLEALPKPFKVQKFAVTLEPEGGVPQPTGEMYLIGDI